MKYTCCFCGNRFDGYGNNPYPLDKTPGHQCCDECNKKVIKARYNILKEQSAFHKLHMFGLLDDGRIVQLFNSDGSIKNIKQKDNKLYYYENKIVKADKYEILEYEILYDADSPEELEQINKRRNILCQEKQS